MARRREFLIDKNIGSVNRTQCSKLRMVEALGVSFPHAAAKLTSGQNDIGTCCAWGHSAHD
jgi:hypothetical protein